MSNKKEGKKHILLNFAHYKTPADLGGLRSWHIGSYLIKNFHVTAIIPGVDPVTGKKKSGLTGKLWLRENIDGVTIVWVNSTVNDRSSKIKRAFYYLSSSFFQTIALLLVKNVDLIICTSIPLSAMIFCFLQTKFRKIPFIIEVRDLSTDTAIELGYFKKSYVVKKILKIEAWLFRQADCVIAVSEGWKKGLMEKGVLAEKIAVIPLGFDGKDIYEKYTDWNRNLKDELGISDSFVAAYVGTLGYVFDIYTILEAAKRTAHNKKIVYIFAGGGQLLEYYKQQARDNNLNCIFLGGIPKSDIPLLCSQADICLCPYKKGKYLASILGNKVFDYLGNGTAIIYSGPSGDVATLIKHSSSGVCLPSGDDDGIASSIIYFFKNPAQSKQAGVNGKKYINEHYKVSTMMEKFESCVRSLL